VEPLLDTPNKSGRLGALAPEGGRVGRKTTENRGMGWAEGDFREAEPL